MSVGVWNFNHVSKFVSVSVLLQSSKDKTPINSINGFEKIKTYYTEKFLFSLFETSIMSRMVERVCKIVLILTAADWFSPIILTNVYCIRFIRIVIKIL